MSKSVEEFINSKKTVLDFLSLKVNGGGTRGGDKYSVMNIERLEELVSSEDLKQVKKYCKHEVMSDYGKSLRWVLRGLNPRDAVKKTVIDCINSVVYYGN